MTRPASETEKVLLRLVERLDQASWPPWRMEDLATGDIILAQMPDHKPGLERVIRTKNYQVIKSIDNEIVYNSVVHNVVSDRWITIDCSCSLGDFIWHPMCFNRETGEIETLPLLKISRDLLIAKWIEERRLKLLEKIILDRKDRL
jgi:hypothetical protein